MFSSSFHMKSHRWSHRYHIRARLLHSPLADMISDNSTKSLYFPCYSPMLLTRLLVRFLEINHQQVKQLFSYVRTTAEHKKKSTAKCDLIRFNFSFVDRETIASYMLHMEWRKKRDIKLNDDSSSGLRWFDWHWKNYKFINVIERSTNESWCVSQNSLSFQCHN